jgi:hypothetical protein
MLPSLLALLLPLCAVAADSRSSEAIGPLRVNPDNPCWFVQPDGQAVWLTGSHTWANFQERGVELPFRMWSEVSLDFPLAAASSNYW